MVANVSDLPVVPTPETFVLPTGVVMRAGNYNGADVTAFCSNAVRGPTRGRATAVMTAVLDETSPLPDWLVERIQALIA